jgi:hypothetical protein
LNASSILIEALDTKEHYSLVTKRHNIVKLLQFAVPEANDIAALSNVDSQNAALSVLNQVV